MSRVWRLMLGALFVEAGCLLAFYAGMLINGK